jgi:hypothetical protein
MRDVMRLLLLGFTIFSGCEQSEPRISISTGGHSYSVSLGSVQQIELECKVGRDEACNICIDRIRATEAWIALVEESYTKYLASGGTDDQYEAQVQRIQSEQSLSRNEAVAVVLKLPELPQLIAESQQIGLPKISAETP